jgi:hypothetical protein
MISPEERRRLVERYQYEPAYIVGTLLKCGACLLLIVGLMVVVPADWPADRPPSQARLSNGQFGTALPGHPPEARVSVDQPVLASGILDGPSLSLTSDLHVVPGR